MQHNRSNEHREPKFGQAGNIPRQSHISINNARFNNRVIDPRLYGGQKQLIPQDVSGTFNQLPTRYQAAHEANHIFF